MKKFRFALLALGVAVITFAFTPISFSGKAPRATVYGFSLSGTYLGSGTDTMAIKNSFCPGANVNACAEVWSSKTIDNQPAGTLITTLKKP